MSRATILAFFPACIDWLRDDQRVVSKDLVDQYLFPVSIAEQCPEVTVGVDFSSSSSWITTMLLGKNTPQQIVVVRQPILLLFALLGILIGLWGLWEFGVCQLAKQRNARISSYGYLAIAFGAFGMMNASAVLVHCWWEAPFFTYPESYPKSWICDTYMTGVSASSLVFAGLNERWTRNYNKSITMRRTLLFGVWLLCQKLGMVCVGIFLMSPSTMTHLLELWYLIPAIMAAFPVTLVLFRKKDNDATNLLLARILLVVGFVTGVTGIALDATFCRWFEGALWDFPMASTLMFLGCDLSFVAIGLGFPRSRDHHQIEKPKTGRTKRQRDGVNPTKTKTS